MAAFHKANICWCSYQPSPYKEIRRKIQNYCALNRQSAWNLPKFQSSQDILFNNGPKVPKLCDKEIYEICCNSKKRNSNFKNEEDSFRIENKHFLPEMEAPRNHAPENQKNSRNPAEIGGQSLLPGQRIPPYATPISIAKRPLVSASPRILFSRPSLQLSLSESKSLNYTTPTLLAQRPTTPKKHKRREQHRKKLKENVQVQDSKKQESIKQDRPSKRKGGDKFQHQSDLNKTQNAPQDLRLNKKSDHHYRNALGQPKLERIREMKKQKSFAKNSEQALFKQLSTERVTKSNLRRTGQLDTSLGIYRKIKEDNKPQVGFKPYSSMLEEVNGEMSKHFSTLRSMHELKVPVPEQSPHRRTSDRSTTPYTETFDEMLRGKISEFHPILKSSNRLEIASTMSKKISKNRKGKTVNVGAKFSRASKNTLKGRLRTETRTFDELITDRDMKMPERLPLLKSRTLLGSTVSIHETKGLSKSKPRKNPEPSSLRATETHRHMSGDKANERHSKPFGKMLRGKEMIIPELNRALTSHFRINHAGQTTSSNWMDQDPIASTPPFAEQEVLQPSEKVLATEKRVDVRPSHQISIIKKPEIWQTFREHSVMKEPEVSQDSATVPLAPKPKNRITTAQPKSKYQSSTSSEFSLRSIRSSRHRVSPAPGRKIKLKKFSYYIKNSVPDRRILAQMNSKYPISYLKSERTTFYGRTPSQTSSDRYQQSVGSVISTAGIAQSLIAKQKREINKHEALDADEHLFESFPDDYDPLDGIKKTMSDIIAGVAKEEKSYKKSQSKRSKHKAKTHDPADPALGAFSDRQSILSLRRTSQEVKTRESQALKDLHMREQVHETFYAKERASVQARIEKLMQEVAIREDFRPKKKPRDFVTENIVRLSNMPPTKGSLAVENGKPQKKYPSLIRILAPHEYPVNLSRVPKIPEVNMCPATDPPKPIRIRLYSDKIWRDQMNTYQSEMKKPSADAKVCRLSERKKCDCYLCKLLLKGKHQRESHFIQKAKAQRRRLELRSYYLELRKRERERGMCCP